MRAIELREFLGPASLEVVERTTPEAGPGGVLVDVAFAGVSFVDYLQTHGQYHDRPDLPFVLGMEFSGTVRSSSDARFSTGARVMGFARNGAFADVVSADPRVLFEIPDALGMDAAAGLVLNQQTAGFALLERAGLQAGQTVAVLGAAGGVGTACLQLASAMGARCIGVVSSEEKSSTAERAGAADVVVPVDESWTKEVRALAPAGVDVVVDAVGGNRFGESLRVLAPGGQIVVVGFASGTIPEVGANRLLFRNISVVGAAWGEWLKHDDDMPRRVHAALQPYLRRGQLTPIIDSIVPLREAGSAVARLGARSAQGKVLLSVGG